MKNINKIAREAEISPSKTKKILIAAGVYECALSKKIADMRLQGMSKEHICNVLDISFNLYSANSIYEKGMYNSPNATGNAIKIRKCRRKKNEIERDKESQKNDDSASV